MAERSILGMSIRIFRTALLGTVRRGRDLCRFRRVRSSRTLLG